MLNLEAIEAGYGRAQVLFGVSLSVTPGQIHCLMGRNGAGKTTCLKTVMGLLPLVGGRIEMDGEDISNLPAHAIAAKRIGYVPQGRRLFSEMSVGENIEVGLMARSSDASVRDWIFELFPRLRERLKQRAETLSGGEQQMLAMARALCVQPKALLLDEPTEGLQPSMIQVIRDVMLKLRDDNVAILLVEQRLDAVMAIADELTVIENGRPVDAMSIDRVRSDPTTLHSHLGI